MYKVSTYFYWLLITLIRINCTIVYGILRIFRYPVLKLTERLAYSKCSLKVIWIEPDESISKYAEQEENDFESEAKRSDINIYIKDKNLILRIAAHGTLALGEGLINEQIYCESIEELTLRVMEVVGTRVNPLFKLRDWIYLNATEFPWNDSQAGWLAKDNREVLYEMMGGHGNYNFISGYWDRENMSIDAALNRNMEQIAEKLELKPGMTVIDIGCGIGIFANYLASNYDVNVVGVNLSEEEIELGLTSPTKHPNVHLVHGDYKCLLSKDDGKKFDRVVSIHLIEHLGGPKEYGNYFRTIKEYMKPNGKCFIQVIVNLKPIPLRADLFLRKYLLSNQVTPYLSEIMDGIKKRKLTIERNESFGENYSKTFQNYIDNLREAQKLGRFNSKSIGTKKLISCTEIGLRLLVVFIKVKQVEVLQILLSNESESRKK